MSFVKDIEKFNVKFNGITEKVFRAVSLDMFSKVILRSPVGNPDIWLYKHPQRGYVDYVSERGYPEGYVGGRFRANWQASINLPASGEVNSTDKSGRATMSKSRKAINSSKIGDRVYLINNLPYGQALEDGHSSQAPQGMVKTTVNEYRRIVEKQARRHKK